MIILFMIFKIIKRDTHEIFFFLIYFEKNRLYDSGPSFVSLFVCVLQGGGTMS